jgi:hypothetical protein
MFSRMAKIWKKSTDPSTLQQLQFYLQEYGGHYVGASDELPEPTEDALISSFERILLTSTPVQDAFMTLRRISRWESPWQSATYMITYFVFLFYSYITRAFVSKVLIMSFFPTLTCCQAPFRVVHRHQTEILPSHYSRAPGGSKGR